MEEPVDATPSSPGGPLNAPGKELVAVSSFIKPIADGYIIKVWRCGETGLAGGHLGLDVFTRRGPGTPVQAIADGEIALIATKVGDYIDVVVIRHRLHTAVGPNFSEYVYSVSTHVDMARGLYLGKSVKQGEVLGFLNNSLGGGQPHAHFVMYDHEFFLRGLQSDKCRVSNGCPPAGYLGNYGGKQSIFEYNFPTASEYYRLGSYGYILNPENFFSMEIRDF
ncbi:MAG: peptidoglycan DD-metalloendopeptidase family protein [Oligoflexales bacterium]|nr:peptidoglycan DD-metalloendopeptidase family protein [Oligoflexales bacterium]